MDINSLIAQYGYAALVVGSLAEGETITLLGGVAAHQGLLKFPLRGRGRGLRRHDRRSVTLSAGTPLWWQDPAPLCSSS
ncbi:Inner membrane protein yohD [Citrobacter amalonaticus]|nr:Inner membrane protein yohD [Citrobacter amalonaticus]